MVRKRNEKSEKTEKRKFKTADKISYFGQRRQKNDITLSGVFFLPIVGDAIADLRFSEEVEAEMSEQSLFRRSAPYKSDQQHQTQPYSNTE